LVTNGDKGGRGYGQVVTSPSKKILFEYLFVLYPFKTLIAPATREGGGKPKIVTNGDKGGRGVKKSHFCGDVIFERPLIDLDLREIARKLVPKF
jgi:hypothetical protein